MRAGASAGYVLSVKPGTDAKLGTDAISLVGWLVSSAGSAPRHQVVGALVAVVVITATGFAVHRRVERLIDALEEI